MEKLTLKEQKILWAVLNQAQHIGLLDTIRLIKQKEGDIIDPVVNDWFKQTVDEYDVINTLKAKLCGDLE